MGRHLSIVKPPEPDPLEGWPPGTLTATMDVLGRLKVSDVSTVSDLARSMLVALEPVVAQREKTAVGKALDALEAEYGPQLTASQRSLVIWMRNRK